MRVDETIEPRPSDEQLRKPYRPPELEELGTITELTQSVVGNPTDGGAQGSEGSQI